MKWLIVPAVLLLFACGGSALTPASVEAALSGAGASSFQQKKAPETVPQSYTAHATFMVAGKTAQYFVCDTKKNCDALFAYFDALKALAGPYTYQSGSGLVVVQLNSGLAPAQARPIEQAVKTL